MRKLLLLICALLTGVSGAWATDVTVINNSQSPTTYGTFSNSIFTTNVTSGMAGVTISGFNVTKATNFSYGACIGVETSASGTITFSAPDGYIVTGYSLRARSNTSTVSYDLTPSAGTLASGGTKVTTSTGGVDLSVSGLSGQTASFTYSASKADHFYIPSMTIYVFSASATLINVTYNLYESDGETLVGSKTVVQEANSEINVPSSLDGPEYYNYATSGTIGDEDCAITVTRTLKSGWAIALSDLSNSKCYNIQNNRGWWAVANGASEINSTGGLGLATSTSDTKQQFAFLHYVDDYDNDNNGNVYDGYYLYSVNVGKFAYVDGTKLSLSTLDAFSSPALSKVTFQSSTSTDYKNTAPTVVTLDGKSYGVHPSATPKVYQYSPHLDDGGNASAIKEAGAFTPTTAITALKNFLYPTLDSGDTYTFNIYQNDNTTPLNLSLTTSLESVKYVVTENGTNTEGRTVYSLKNASTGKYLSYTNSSKSSNGSDTRLSWADNATNSKFLFSNAYNGRLAIRPAAASADNYLTAWDIVSGKNVIFWNDANANNKNMSYWTVTKVGHAVTYNLIWNSETIKTTTVSSVVTGEESSDYVPWSVPAYCSFSYDVDEIEESTRTVNVTMTWDGPFDISADFNTAKWYYLKVNGKWAVYGNFKYNNILITQPYDNETNAQNAIAKSMWAFVGNPYDGFEIMNRHAGSGMYLNSQSGVAMFMSSSNEFTTFKIAQKEGNTFSMNNGGYYINCGASYIAANSGVSENATSSLMVEDIPYKFLALAYLPEYAASHHMGEYFGVDESSYNSVMTTITNAASISENDYNSLVSNLSPKLPETGYYRIKSSGSRGDQSYITYGYLDGSKGTGLLTTIGNKETDFGTVVKLTRVGTSKNYKISIQGLNVQAHSGDNTLFRATGDEGQSFQFNHINFSGMCSIYDGTDHGNMHEAGWKKQDTGLNGVVGWDAGDGTNASSWCLEDASTIEVTLNNGGDGFYYATCFTDFPVSYTGASNGEGLFVLTGGESNGKVTAQKVAAVPAQQGFLIRIAAENVTDSKVTLTIPASADALAGENILTGTCLATTKPDGNVYVFSKVEDDLGFFPYTGTDIPANRAYIVESDGNVRSFILSFDDTTGINGVSTSMPAGTIFDMQGRRVNKAEKGLYIVNGKKVLF